MKFSNSSIFVFSEKAQVLRQYLGGPSCCVHGRNSSRRPKLNAAPVKQIKALLKDPSIKVVDIAKFKNIALDRGTNLIPVRVEYDPQLGGQF